MKDYQIRPVFKEWALTVAREHYQLEIDKFKTLIIEQQKHISKLEKELNTLVDLRISNEINDVVYCQKKAEREQQLIRAKSKRALLEEQTANWIKKVEDYLNYAVNVVERFKRGDATTKKEICIHFGWNWSLKGKKLFIDKEKWLQSIRNYKDGVERIFGRLEPEKNFTTKGYNSSLETISPLVCGIIDEVRTDKDVFPK